MPQPDVLIPVTTVADTVRLAVAPVFLLSGIGAFLNVRASRLSRPARVALGQDPRRIAPPAPRRRCADKALNLDKARAKRLSGDSQSRT